MANSNLLFLPLKPLIAYPTCRGCGGQFFPLPVPFPPEQPAPGTAGSCEANPWRWPFMETLVFLSLPLEHGASW